MIADQMFSVGIAVVAVYAVAVGIALFLGMGKTPRRELGMILVNAASSPGCNPSGMWSMPSPRPGVGRKRPVAVAAPLTEADPGARVPE